jgi:hypothetical protein
MSAGLDINEAANERGGFNPKPKHGANIRRGPVDRHARRCGGRNGEDDSGPYRNKTAAERGRIPAAAIDPLA